MIYHCIRFTPKPGLTPEVVADALRKMREHSDAIEAITSSTVGRDFGGEYAYGSVSLIENIEKYEEFMNDPAHLDMDRIGLPLVDRFMSFDITDDPDPEIGEKIAEIHRRRYEDKPDIADLVSGLGDYAGSAAPGKHAE